MELEKKYPITMDSTTKVAYTGPVVRGTGFAMSVFNVMNAILGSGILALAFAMSLVGIGFFVIMLIVVAILALYAVHLLLELCDQTNVKSYERLGYIAFGRMGRIVTAIFILVQNMGAMASYLYIVKYELPNVLMTLLGKVENNGESYLNGDLLIIVITIAIILPLSSLRTIGILGYASGFSISCMFFFLCVIIYKMFHIPCPLYDDVLFKDWDTVGNLSVNDIESTVTTMYNLTTTAGNLFRLKEAHELYENFGTQKCEASLLDFKSNWAYSIPMMTYSFLCHTTVLPIYAELDRPSAARMQRVTNCSVAICFAMYLTSALFGYLTFYNWMEAEMLLMYSFINSTDVMTLVVRLTVIFAVILTIPLTHFPTRQAINYLVFPGRDFSWARHLGVMMVILIFINIVVIFVPSIQEIIGFVGAAASFPIVFIVPPAFYLKLDKKPLSHPKKISAIVMAVVGTAVMFLNLSQIVMGWFAEKEKHH